MIFSSFINYQKLQYQDYIYPDMANILGIIFALSSASAIPIVGIYMFFKQKAPTLREVFYIQTYILFSIDFRNGDYL